MLSHPLTIISVDDNAVPANINGVVFQFNDKSPFFTT